MGRDEIGTGEAAALLGISGARVRALVAGGRLPAREGTDRGRRVWVLPRAAVAAFGAGAGPKGGPTPPGGPGPGDPATPGPGGGIGDGGGGVAGALGGLAGALRALGPWHAEGCTPGTAALVAAEARALAPALGTLAAFLGGEEARRRARDADMDALGAALEAMDTLGAMGTRGAPGVSAPALAVVACPGGTPCARCQAAGPAHRCALCFGWLCEGCWPGHAARAAYWPDAACPGLPGGDEEDEGDEGRDEDGEDDEEEGEEDGRGARPPAPDAWWDDGTGRDGLEGPRVPGAEAEARMAGASVAMAALRAALGAPGSTGDGSGATRAAALGEALGALADALEGRAVWEAARARQWARARAATRRAGRDD